MPRNTGCQYLKKVSWQSYDLFLHNCNNFTNDFATFLVGKGIPKHITSLPQTVLDTPFGQMLKPQLDQALRGVTQAPVPPGPAVRNGVGPGLNASSQKSATTAVQPPPGQVQEVTELAKLNSLLEKAKSFCAAIFFTSATCAPCKICYPSYDSLAAELEGKATLIKVDIDFAGQIASQYGVHTTPTFMTFLKGSKLEEWAGADPAKLLGNIRLLVQMAHPPHPHSQLRLNLLQRRHKPITYSRVPPIEKLLAKLEPSQSSHPSVQSLKKFIEARNASTTAASAIVPDLRAISAFIRSFTTSPTLSHPPFPLIDLLRLSCLDPRVSGFFCEEASSSSLILYILKQAAAISAHNPTSSLAAISAHNPTSSLAATSAYPFILTTTQTIANLFSSPLAQRTLLQKAFYRIPLLELVSNILASTNELQTTQESSLRASAASLGFNIANAVHKQRFKDSSSSTVSSTETEVLGESAQVELLAALLEALSREAERDDKAASKETTKALLLAVGLVAYERPEEGEVRDLLQAMNAKETVEKLGSVDGCKEMVQDVKRLVV